MKHTGVTSLACCAVSHSGFLHWLSTPRSLDRWWFPGTAGALVILVAQGLWLTLTLDHSYHHS